jgi:hypothetical protein
VIIELVLFKPIAGTSRAVLDSAIAESTRFLERQPGFIRRSIGVNEAGVMADLVSWESQTAADDSMAAFQAADETRAFMKLIDPETVEVRHFASLAESDAS